MGVALPSNFRGLHLQTVLSARFEPKGLFRRATNTPAASSESRAHTCASALVSDLDTSPELREIALLTTGATYVQADALIEIADRSSGVIVIAVLATVVDGRAVTEIVNRLGRRRVSDGAALHVRDVPGGRAPKSSGPAPSRPRSRERAMTKRTEHVERVTCWLDGAMKDKAAVVLALAGHFVQSSGITVTSGARPIALAFMGGLWEGTRGPL